MTLRPSNILTMFCRRNALSVPTGYGDSAGRCAIKFVLINTAKFNNTEHSSLASLGAIACRRPMSSWARGDSKRNQTETTFCILRRYRWNVVVVVSPLAKKDFSIYIIIINRLRVPPRSSDPLCHHAHRHPLYPLTV